MMVPPRATPIINQAVLLDTATLGVADLDLSRLHAQAAAWREYPQTLPGQVAERIAGAEIVVSNKVVLTAAHLASADKLKLICVAATGTNNIDLVAAREQGICVSNAQHYSTESVAQHTLSLMLLLAGRTISYIDDVRAGAWSAQPLFCLLNAPIHSLAGKTLGIVGYGNIGARVRELAHAMGMKVLIAQLPHRPMAGGRTPLDELLAQSDVVSLHCPLVPETEQLMNAERFAVMRSGAIFINVARGGLVDESALLNSLQSGHLVGAGLDVLSQEPPAKHHPLLQAGLANLLITPHIAWAAQSSRQALIEQLAENIASFAAGHPLRRVA